MSMPSPAPPDRALLGAFELTGELLGRGGFADVWAARHRATGWSVAIKQPRAQSDTVLGESLSMEAQALARLQHPGIVGILDVLPGDGIVMERAETTVAERSPAVWTELRTLLLYVLDALAHVHSHGLVHRDIKPSNLLLGVRREPREPMVHLTDGFRLADFGIATKLLERDRWPTAGSPAYRAPEQREGRWLAFGPWTDLFSVGCLARRLGVRLEAVPAGFDAWTRWLSAEEATDRPDRAVEAARALLALGAPTAVVTEPPASPLSGLNTLTHLEPVAVSSFSPPLPSSGAAEVRRLPEDWRSGEPVWPAMELVDAGLGLLDVRDPPIVGQEALRDGLWSALREVAEQGVPRILSLQGPVGSGRRALARWLAARAHAVGAAEVERVDAAHLDVVASGIALKVEPHRRVRLLVGLDVDSVPIVAEAMRRAEGPVLAVLARGSVGEPWPVPALPTGLIRQLIRSRLHLVPGLVEHLVDRSEGLPGKVRHWLSEWTRRGLLQRTPAGFTHVDGEAPIGRASSTKGPNAEVRALLDKGDPEAAWARFDAALQAHQVDSFAFWFDVLDALGAGPDDPRRLLVELCREKLYGTDLPGQWQRLTALSRRARHHGSDSLVDDIEVTRAQLETTRRGDAAAARKRLAAVRKRVIARNDMSLLCWVHIVSVWPSTLLGHHEEAAAFADRAVALSEDTPRLRAYALLVRARALRGLERIAEAVESCRAGLEAQGNKPSQHRISLLFTLASLLEEDERGDEAVSVFEEAIALAVEKGWLDAEGLGRNNFGWLLLRLGRPLDAEAHFRIAVDRYHQGNRSDAAVRIGLAIALALDGDWHAALAMLADIETQKTLRPGTTTAARRLVQAWCAAELGAFEHWPSDLQDYPVSADTRSGLFEDLASRTVRAAADAGWTERVNAFERWWSLGEANS